MRGAAAWLSRAGGWMGVAIAQGPGTGVPAAIRQLGVAGSANAHPTVSARGSFVAVAWGVTAPGKGTDVYVSVSRDGGVTFGAPVRANAEPGEARISAERPPVVAVVPSDQGTPDVAVLWTAGGTHTTLKLARSGDGGRTFARPREIQTAGAPGNRGWASMTADENGTLHVVWLDHRDTAGPLRPVTTLVATPTATAPPWRALGALLRTGRRQGRAERLLARGVCYCCKTAVAAGPDNRIAAAWRHVYPGNLRDIAAVTSADVGRYLHGAAAGQRGSAGPSTAVPRTAPAWRSTPAGCTWRGRPWSVGASPPARSSMRPRATAAASHPACGFRPWQGAIPNMCKSPGRRPIA